jgi:hypothetical protein
MLSFKSPGRMSAMGRIAAREHQRRHPRRQQRFPAEPADGRVFTFSAADDGAGKISLAALDGTERTSPAEFATVVAVEHIDALGRVAQCMRAASPS